ncbi:MAG TPA: anaerobic sulfatase maturase [Patescibacteria group bacterium]|nr:anaerobic sulfatase maturase [Patescibacteria group bacterium]
MAKPTGADCNLNCAYCFFLKKDKLYPGSTFRMSDEVHDAYIRQLFSAHAGSRVIVAWQGGEPTLMGLGFFKRSVEFQRSVAISGTIIENTFQTNGILLDDEWCRFFYDNNFLVGLSLDGPRELHDIYRKDKGGSGTFERVMKAVRLLQKHRVEFNILCTVNAKNADYPLKVYRFFRDEAKTSYLQFIPIVERDNESGYQEGDRVTARSVRPEPFGRFLIAIFDEWVRNDVGRMFVLNFDGALAGWLGMAGTLCIFSPTCGQGMALEDNGDLYSCDHFVEPDYFLGNILRTSMTELATSKGQRQFGQNKRDKLANICRQCKFLFACNGECPKNRFVEMDDDEPLNYLCGAYKSFFAHAEPSMKIMAELLRQGRLAEEVMQVLKYQERSDENGNKESTVKSGRNEPCFCGSGRKFKHCHGK